MDMDNMVGLDYGSGGQVVGKEAKEEIIGTTLRV